MTEQVAGMEQFVLPFPLDSVCLFSNLVVGEGNRLAVKAAKKLDLVARCGLTLVGEQGTGKSHLLHAAVKEWQKRIPSERAAYFSGEERLIETAQSREEALALFMRKYGHLEMVAVDNLERMRDPVMQEAVLYLYNHLKEQGGRLLFASRVEPGLLTQLRDDLRTRILWGPVIMLASPGEQELAAILEKMAEDRQVMLSRALSHFLHIRLPRTVPDYAHALAKLDQAALSLKRPLTVPLAKGVLGL
ncbi:DnaA/Hda family protein [Magnetococcales bacterium HHB-1]